MARKNSIDDDYKIKLDFKNVFNIASDETSAEIDDISNDFKEDTVRSRLRMEERAFSVGMDGSFDKERAEMTETFENEKNDIVKGFILEKRILNSEHEKEKQDLISNFVQERQRMLDNFQQQVKDIERKMSSKVQRPQCLGKSENVFDLTSEAHQTKENKISPPTTPGKLLIKLDGNRILTPEQFLSAMELEERFESEREVIEKSFRKEKHLLRDKLDVEYAKKLNKEREKHNKELHSLHNEIDKLRNLKNEVGDMWKTQASQLESEFFKERTSLERHHVEEKENLRRRLEERNQTKLRAQQEDYDRMIRDLRNELQSIKKEVTKNEENKVNERPTIEIRKQIEEQLHSHYENETRLLRQQAEKLNGEIQNLTTEKYDLSRKLRELEHEKMNESKDLKNQSERLNKEYGERVKKLMAQNEKLKSHISSIEKQKEEMKLLIESQENNARGVKGRLESTERTIVQYEDMLTNLRRENSNLSHEIKLLRIEKEELSSIISQHNEQERSVKIDVQRLQADAVEVKKKITLLEREKIKLEKVNHAFKKESEKWKGENKKTLAKLEACTRETERIRDLLEGERNENKRLHERFKNDADLLRKKDGENNAVRTQLDNIKTQFETLKTRIESDNEKFCKLEMERSELKKQVEKMKASGKIMNQHEHLKIQKSYCKEFAKRLEYVKANYEREIFNLKERIGELTQNGFNEEKKATPRPPLHCKNCTSSNTIRKLPHGNVSYLSALAEERSITTCTKEKSFQPPPKETSQRLTSHMEEDHSITNEQSIRERLTRQREKPSIFQV